MAVVRMASSPHSMRSFLPLSDWHLIMAMYGYKSGVFDPKLSNLGMAPVALSAGKSHLFPRADKRDLVD